ncbi:GIY-YIG nuclease family protein [Spiroplasma endosymbiont of Sarcophaga variegata]|uniref:GIY-YIG nuclease family protein n=1 Tax=Spiroplasma endosymbiont of Sarcophaga variegata TaxID=3066304 RepID=UPI003AF6983E
MDDKLFQCFGIYAIFTLNQFRVYVGQTKDSFYDRIKEHYKSLWELIHQLNGKKFRQHLFTTL